MNSEHQEVFDFTPNPGLFALSDFNNEFLPQSNLTKQNKWKETLQGFNPNFPMNNQNENDNNEIKEIQESNRIQNKKANSNNRKNANAPSYFFHDYDDDSENNDHERLIINTINDLENLDDSNHFEILNFDAQEVK